MKLVVLSKFGGVAMSDQIISLKSLKEIGEKNFAIASPENSSEIVENVISFQDVSVGANLTEIFFE